MPNVIADYGRVFDLITVTLYQTFSNCVSRRQNPFQIQFCHISLHITKAGVEK